MLILKPKWSWIWTPPSLSVLLGCFKRTLTLFTPHWPRMIQDVSSPHNSRTTHAKINDYQLFSTTCLDLYTHAAPMPKHFTHWQHQQRWNGLHWPDRVQSRGTRASTLYHWCKCAKILLLCFQIVGQNKDLDCSIFTDLFYLKYITALKLSQFFNLSFRVVCCFGGSWSCKSVFLSSCWWSASCWWFFLVGNENWCFQCVEGFTSLIHPANTPHVTFFCF